MLWSKTITSLGMFSLSEAMPRANMVRTIAGHPPSAMWLTSIPRQLSSIQNYVSLNNFEKKERIINSIFTECLRFIFLIQESLKVLETLSEN